MSFKDDSAIDTQVIFSQPVPHHVMSPLPKHFEGYPRPDFYHSHVDWTILNGSWDFCFDDEDVGTQQHWQFSGIPPHHPERRTIKVPFVFQAPASGIHDTKAHEVLWYERSIIDPRNDKHRHGGDRVLLRFGAVDYEATAWLGGHLLGTHRGGHVPFDLDITDVFDARPDTKQKRLTVRVFDSATNKAQPRGKQFWGPRSEGIFYTPSSGIWQSVWMEVLPSTRIADSTGGTIIRSDAVEDGDLHALVALVGKQSGRRYLVEVETCFAGSNVSSTGRVDMPEANRVELRANMKLSREHFESLPEDLLRASPLDDPTCWLNNVALWSPDHPLLYDIFIRLFDEGGQLLDEVVTSTGMRTISWDDKDGTLRLNGSPYFHALVLDQGYWTDTLMTPPNAVSCRNDIELAKAMGFNGCRKHQKVEDPLFLYWADRLGYMVWGEMASAFQYSAEFVECFDQEWSDAVKRDLNHPSVVAWTLANESWGYGELETNVEQRNNLRSLYYRTKTLDPSRPINDNSGWHHVYTDLVTFHEYADAKALRDRCQSIQDIITTGQPMFLGPLAADQGSSFQAGSPVICAEFGGVNISVAGKDNQHQRGWGYTTASNAEDLLDRIERLFLSVTHAGHICGFVWTQLTDVEQETNGLYTTDRKEKLPAEMVKMAVEEAAEAYLAQHTTTPRSIGFRAGLESCYNIHLEDEQYLVAECALDAQHKRWRQSRINLNDCFTNAFGRITWSKGGNFKASSQNIRLTDGGLTLEADAGDGTKWVHNRIRLDERLRNNKGMLEMF